MWWVDLLNLLFMVSGFNFNFESCFLISRWVVELCVMVFLVVLNCVCSFFEWVFFFSFVMCVFVVLVNVLLG